MTRRVLTIVAAAAAFLASLTPCAALAQNAAPDQGGVALVLLVEAPEDASIPVTVRETAEALRERLREHHHRVGAEADAAVEGGRIVVTAAPGASIAELRDLVTRNTDFGLHVVADPKDARRRVETLSAPDEPDGRLAVFPAALSGNVIEAARAGWSDYNGAPQIEITLRDEASERFCALTRAHEGERIAIVVDGEVLSAPLVHTPICAGAMVVTGGFSTEQARDLADALRWTLPARVSVLEQRIVGPAKRR